jgi:hypothetical protein
MFVVAKNNDKEFTFDDRSVHGTTARGTKKPLPRNSWKRLKHFAGTKVPLLQGY